MKLSSEKNEFIQEKEKWQQERDRSTRIEMIKIQSELEDLHKEKEQMQIEKETWLNDKDRIQQFELEQIQLEKDELMQMK